MRGLCVFSQYYSFVFIWNIWMPLIKKLKKKKKERNLSEGTNITENIRNLLDYVRSLKLLRKMLCIDLMVLNPTPLKWTLNMKMCTPFQSRINFTDSINKQVCSRLIFQEFSTWLHLCSHLASQNGHFLSRRVSAWLTRLVNLTN